MGAGETTPLAHSKDLADLHTRLRPGALQGVALLT